ncbi:membrane steroid-binding protein 2-like [Telopea speciosissima]|uniref:membrane steroid-binding protein 2-like n=1 Tax=Telopea speciosissima TaxID=54955 RepID=UPI001CC82F47|nr:membrane steroid-binding protein 2-like [Telopea speciosissima]
MAFSSTITDAIAAYTGLSPAAFFTILALMIGVYRLVSGMFVGPEELKPQERSFSTMEIPAVVEPVQLGEITEEELRVYNGSDPKKPLLMAIKGNVYDVSMSRMFYGPGGPYALFAGRDASRALALMSFDPQDLTGNLEGLEPDELEVLQDWEYKFMEKYVKVGQLVSEKGKNACNGWR